MDPASLYSVLGIQTNASQEEIKKQYRKLSLVHHPDRTGGNNELFKRVSDAYETLSDPLKKQFYDARFVPVVQAQPAAVSPHAPAYDSAPLVVYVDVTFEQSYFGFSRPVKLERNGRHGVETETIYAEVPRGIDDNEVIIVPNKGNYGPAGLGDVKVVVRLKPHEVFKRDGMDLLYEHRITLKESLCGFVFTFEHLNNKMMRINNTTGELITPNYKKVLPGLGVVRGQTSGNLVITFKIDYPDLSPAQVEQLRNIL